MSSRPTKDRSGGKAPPVLDTSRRVQERHGRKRICHGTVEGHLSAEGLDFSIIVSRFNDFITMRLLDGALDALLRHGARDEQITVYRVPGAFEIPMMAKKSLIWARLVMP